MVGTANTSTSSKPKPVAPLSFPITLLRSHGQCIELVPGIFIAQADGFGPHLCGVLHNVYAESVTRRGRPPDCCSEWLEGSALALPSRIIRRACAAPPSNWISAPDQGCLLPNTGYGRRNLFLRLLNLSISGCRTEASAASRS